MGRLGPVRTQEGVCYIGAQTEFVGGLGKRSDLHASNGPFGPYLGFPVGADRSPVSS